MENTLNLENLTKAFEQAKLDMQKPQEPPMYIVSQRQYNLMKDSYERTGSLWSWLK